MMKTFTTPGKVRVDATDNVVSALLSRCEVGPDHAALAQRVDGRYQDISTAEFVSDVRHVAAGIVALGLEPGTRIALFCSTRWEFTLFDYAIWAAGCVSVTIYESSSVEQVEWIIGDSGATMLVCESALMRAKYDSISDDLPDCVDALVIDDGAAAVLKERATDSTLVEVDRRIDAIGHGDLASLVYTSGTTGRPKGCILTHGNFIWELRQLESMAPALLNDTQRQLMFLPLAHVWARLVEVACVSTGVTIYYSTGISRLTEELALAEPTWMFGVPRVFEKIYNAAKHRADASGKGAIFDRATDVAIRFSIATDAGTPGVLLRMQHAVFDRLVYSKLRSVFGGELQYVISGGAPLGTRLGHFFRGIGVTVLEGYGLTETTAGTSQNTPEATRIGSVGRPFPGTTVRIADDGEILIKGGQIFSGYWKNERATLESIDADGWFHSGDIGEIDSDGFLTITGRKKEIIVTAGGKNVAPAVLEDRIRANPLISQVVVVGEAKPFIAALVTIDADALPEWASSNGKTSAELSDLLDDPDFKSAIQGAIDAGNEAVSRAESIREYRILPRDLSIERGELTPTFKVRRSVITDRYADVVADIYG
jgi:long-chain acyl-CoA synthetase